MISLEEITNSYYSGQHVQLRAQIAEYDSQNSVSALRVLREKETLSAGTVLDIAIRCGAGRPMLSELTDSEIIDEHKRRFSSVSEKNYISSSRAVKEHLKVVYAGLEQDREHFLCLFLDGAHNIITTETLFTGSINTSAVYPREVIKRVLHHEAVSVVFSHNHPSGSLSPSSSDRAVTKKLKIALDSIDVELLDHVILGGDEFFSFADHRMI